MGCLKGFDRLLLRPLHTWGRKLKPVLLHGDLGYGNLATNGNRGRPITFDFSVFWAHNERRSSRVPLRNDSLRADELDTFNVPRYCIGRQFMQEYSNHVPMSAPEGYYEDPNLLYAM